MPWAPLKPCAHPGCPTLGRSRYCEGHLAEVRKAADARRRGQRHLHGGGASPAWRALRATVLARDPVCRLCGAKPSTVADHITPKRDGGRDTLTNLQGVCAGCNTRKAAADMKARKGCR